MLTILSLLGAFPIHISCYIQILSAQQSYVFLMNTADPKYREEYLWLRNSDNLQGNDRP